MDRQALIRLGLHESDIDVYLSLIKLGKGAVSTIAQQSGVHRTYIYSVLDKLQNMGLVTHFKEGNTLIFKASDPKNLLNYLKETQGIVEDVIPELTKLSNTVNEQVDVQTFRGIKGIKAAYKDIIRTKKDVYGYGVAGQLRKHIPIFAKQWFRDLKEYKIRSKVIHTEGIILDETIFETRALPTSFITPVATHIYGDKVMIVIWEPSYVAIIIRSKETADNYRKHFDLLWKQAKA